MIADSEEGDSISLVFGKAGTDIFHLDIETPFSIIQGIAVAVSAF